MASKKRPTTPPSQAQLANTEDEIAALFDRLVAADVAESVGEEWMFMAASG